MKASYLRRSFFAKVQRSAAALFDDKDGSYFLVLDIVCSFFNIF